MFIKKTIKGVPKNEENLKPNKDGYHMFGQNIKYQYLQKIKLDYKYLQEVDSNYPILAYTSSVGEIGLIKESFYRSGDNGAFQGMFPKSYKFNIKELQFIESIIKKQFDFFGYGTAMSNIMELKIHLPIKSEQTPLSKFGTLTKVAEIDFAFMENFIAEIEKRRIKELEAERMQDLDAYLQVTGLKDYTLTTEEEKVLKDFEKGNIEFSAFSYENVFNKIVQGRRLKKEDQISGTIPFVMAGTTNTGVVNYISNPVASFPKNSITIDIFGNTFYRNYAYGAGDDTGVYWNDEKNYSKKTMLFLASSMEKSIAGKFDFGNKLRSSQSLDFKMKLPVAVPPSGVSGLDYALMETFISAIQKLVIKEVVAYADRKIAATKKVVIRN